MNKFLTMTAVAATFAIQSMTASATVADFSLDFDSLTTSTLGTVGISGGQVFTGTVDNVAKAPEGGSGNFYSVGSPDHPNTEVATMSLTANTYNYINFLWGTVDSENTLVLTLSDGSKVTKTGDDFGADRTKTIEFSFGAGDLFVNSVEFSNGDKGNIAFEIDNFKASAVPEPGVYAMMLAGLGLVGFATRRKMQA